MHAININGQRTIRIQVPYWRIKEIGGGTNRSSFDRQHLEVKCFLFLEYAVLCSLYVKVDLFLLRFGNQLKFVF